MTPTRTAAAASPIRGGPRIARISRIQNGEGRRRLREGVGRRECDVCHGSRSDLASSQAVMDRHLLRTQLLTTPLSNSCDSYNSWSNQVLGHDADANGRGKFSNQGRTTNRTNFTNPERRRKKEIEGGSGEEGMRCVSWIAFGSCFISGRHGSSPTANSTPDHSVIQFV
jgi:hypothetical protein